MDEASRAAPNARAPLPAAVALFHLAIAAQCAEVLLAKKQRGQTFERDEIGALAFAIAYELLVVLPPRCWRVARADT